jgi:phosphoribosyl-ATP pyrophosphohydrolase/phosphoribosyl-AMP cyclohydrolase/histidinol dehydrogenase
VALEKKMNIAWRRLTPEQVGRLDREAVDAATLAAAAEIVEEVRSGGEAAVRRLAERFGDLQPGDQLVLDRAELQSTAARLPVAQLDLLQRTAERIAGFAQVQRAAVTETGAAIPGGWAGHTVAPVACAGCYAPGGRYPLPSSVLMTAVTARVAGVDQVWVASPRPTPVTCAAAAVAAADGLLTVGGAHGVAALAFGLAPIPACDVVVGPGNRWVTAAKKLLVGRIGIDMLAGPSELVVLADESADAELIAADLLAQAEHDPEAQPILVATDPALPDLVESALELQLAELPKQAQEIAASALGRGFAVIAPDLDVAVEVCDRLAPEHLQVLTADADQVARRLTSYGALFIGAASAEVLGDYGAGPNHTLPTGGTARYAGGLSVLDFLRIRTWMRIDNQRESAGLVADAVSLARLEGLEAHARAAERRLQA